MEFKEVDKKEMGARIRARREGLNISREELARLMDVSVKTIENIEYGDRGTTINNLYKIKQILGINIDYLIDGEYAFETTEEKRKMLNENIMGSLSVCSIQQLGRMEKMARLYVENIVEVE